MANYPLANSVLMDIYISLYNLPNTNKESHKHPREML